MNYKAFFEAHDVPESLVLYLAELYGRRHPDTKLPVWECAYHQYCDNRKAETEAIYKRLDQLPVNFGKAYTYKGMAKSTG